MFEDIKIFIPTKGRMNNQKTYKILKEMGLYPILVIEPQEQLEAIQNQYEYLVLPDNNRGITYSRNKILDYARKNKYEYICMIDDDIEHFVRMKNNKRVKDTNDCFLEALEFFKKEKKCGTMQYHQFGVFAKDYVSYNKNIEVVFFLYMPDLDGVYFEEDTIEDRDFSIELVLNRNLTTFRLEQLCFAVPSIGTNKGGIESDSRKEKQIYWSNKMLKKWGPDIIKVVVKKNGLTDIRTNWKNINKIVKVKNNYTQLSFPLYSEENISKKSKKEEKYIQLQFPFMKDFQEV